MLSRALGHVICRKKLLVTVEQQRHNQVNELGGILTLYQYTKHYLREEDEVPALGIGWTSHRRDSQGTHIMSLLGLHYEFMNSKEN
jgi:hypothetical protein